MSERETSRAQASYLPRVLLCLAALTGACGRDEGTKLPARPVPGCETFDVAPCDTQDPACQLSRLELAACMRETTAGKLPLVNVMTEQDYADYLNALYDGKQSPGPNHFELAMTWLGLAEPGSFAFTPLEKADVADWFGTYRWREKDLLLIDHGKPADDAASNVELVAALIRALRDRDINIAAWSTVVSIFDIDSNWGSDALYFGEARFYANRYKASLDGVDPSRVDELGQINARIREDIEWIREQPSPYVATNDRFADNFGSRVAYLAWQRDGVDGVDSLYGSKLLTHQLMASETETGAAPTLKLHRRPIAPSEWVEDPINTAIGAWGLFLSLSRNMPTDAAWSLALAWRGDQIFVYKGVPPSEDTALIWHVEMEDEDSASALEEGLASSDAPIQVQRDGTFVTLAATTSEDSLDWAFVFDE